MCDDHLAAKLRGTYLTYAGATHVLYINSSCQTVSAPAPSQLCGSFNVNYAPSPISLVWDEKSRNSAVLLSQFSLEPGKIGAWHLWRASEAMPLVVYDPDHTGRIYSATQLFGTWTFGGKNSAALGLRGVSSPWSNGYEALATLDIEGDRKLSGEETAPLALWFDRNQNGVSEAGEVVDLRQAGVTALYIVPDRTDPLTGDVHAKLGYERLENGKLTTGASVDWFSASYASEAEAMLSLKAFAAVSATPIVKDEQPLFGAPANAVSPLSGAWLWTTGKGKTGAEAQGLLTFKPSVERELSGHSYVEFELNPPAGEASRMLVSDVLSGKVLDATAEEILFEFTVVSGNNGGKTFNTARWVKAEDKIYGQSKQELIIPDEKKTTALYTYAWTAKRTR